MTNEDILELLLESGKDFSITKGDGIISFSVFDNEDEDEDYSCYPFCAEKDEDDLDGEDDFVKKYEFGIWSLPIGSKKKFVRYEDLKSAPRIGDYCPIYHSEILSGKTGDDLLDEIFYQTQTDDSLWFAPSTSDVIHINGKYYYIDRVGFVEIPNFDKKL